jgi:hypothetical protein
VAEQTPPDPAGAPEPPALEPKPREPKPREPRGPEPRTDGVEADVAEQVDAVLRGRVRRAPRYGAFIASGVVIGLVVGLLAPFLGRGGWTGGVALFLSASGVVLGAVTGAAAAALVDLRSTR